MVEMGSNRIAGQQYIYQCNAILTHIIDRSALCSEADPRSYSPKSSIFIMIMLVELSRLIVMHIYLLST